MGDTETEEDRNSSSSSMSSDGRMGDGEEKVDVTQRESEVLAFSTHSSLGGKGQREAF